MFKEVASKVYLTGEDIFTLFLWILLFISQSNFIPSLILLHTILQNLK